MNNEQLVSTVTTGGFNFGHVPINDDLTDTEYMVGMIAVDRSSSVADFEKEMEDCLSSVTSMNKKLQTAPKIMQRVTAFGSSLSEIHGLQLVNNIDPQSYKGKLQCGGMTALYDATMDAIEASEQFCRDLINDDYDATACLFIITDGCENNSKKIRNAAKIKDKIDALRRDENAFTSPLIAVLIGVNIQDQYVKAELDQFAKEAGLDKFIAMEDATPSSLGKVAGLISQSFSSKSQTVTSKNVQATLSQLTI